MNLFHTYSFPNTKSIVVCGDIHGEFNAVIYKLCIQYQMTDTVLIIAGDCGFGFDKPGYYDTGWRRGGQGRDDGLELVWSWFGGIAETVTSCNSSGTRIGLPGPSKAHPPARWHRFVSIERRQPLQTALQGISARAMISRKITGRPRACHARPSEPG